MTVLVIAEHDNKNLGLNNYAVINAAEQLHDDITVLVAGYQCQSVADQAALCHGVKKVILVDDAVYAEGLAENLANLIIALAKDAQYILAPASTFGKNLLPRVAALLDVSPLSDVIKIVDKETFVRPIYAGNALATVKLTAPCKVMTIRPSAFERVTKTDKPVTIETINQVIPNQQSTFVKRENSVSTRPELTSARVIISGGRGLQSGDNFKLLERIADKLNAAIGASRAAVDAGFVPNDYQVGQTGKIVAPELYIAVGISGAIQHLAGMKDSKVIVAINKDPDAPIFQIADYGLVADLFEALPQFAQELEKLN